MTSRCRVLVSVAVLGCVELFTVACQKPEAVDLSRQAGSLEIEAERLRPDMLPLKDQLPISARETYSDGNVYDQNGNLVSTAVGSEPVDLLLFRDIPGALTHQLTRADCLWVDQGNESARLSYEVVAYDVELEDGTRLPEVSTCGGVLHDPATRAGLRIMSEEDETVLTGYIQLDLDVALTRVEGPAQDDPYRGCDQGDGLIASQPMTTRVLRGTPALKSRFASELQRDDYPSCMIEAAIGSFDQDTSLLLDVVDAHTGDPLAFSGVNAPPLEVPTRVKVVEPSAPDKEFLLARPLGFAGSGAPENEAELTTTPKLWTWTVESRGDGSWRENFSPNLNVSRARVFVEGDLDPDIGERERIYLAAHRVRAYLNYESFPDRELNCRLEDGGGETPPACEDLEGFTPTFRRQILAGIDTLSDRLTWEVVFNEVVERQPIVLPDGSMSFQDVVVEEPPVEPGEAVFIEFHLVRPSHGTSSSGLSVSPPVVDVGDFRVASAPTFGNLFRVENYGQGNLQIQSIALEGRDAAAFRLTRLPRLPFTLRPGTQLALPLHAANGSQHFGRREARVHIRGRDAAGNATSVYGALVGNAVDWAFDTLHPPFYFIARPGVPRALSSWMLDPDADWQKGFMIINNGSAAMPRGQITLTGPDAEQFSVLRSSSETLPASDYFPWVNGEQPPASVTIQPGASETLVVLYHPKTSGVRTLAYGPDEAEIRVRVGDVDYTTPVEGWCVGSCQFSEPVPVGAPSGGGAVVVWPGAAPIPPGGVMEPHETLLMER